MCRHQPLARQLDQLIGEMEADVAMHARSIARARGHDYFISSTDFRRLREQAAVSAAAVARPGALPRNFRELARQWGEWRGPWEKEGEG